MKNYLRPMMGDEEIRGVGSLALAHVGDAVFELMVRTRLCLEGRETAAGLHRAAVKMVNAGAQAAYSEQLLASLTEEEAAVFRRGRNAKVNTMPKNADPADYHAATGLEALFGYLYLKNRQERAAELFGLIMDGPEKQMGGTSPKRGGAV